MKRKALWVIGAILLLTLIYIFYPTAPVKREIRIGMDPQDFGADLYGKDATIVAIINDIVDEMTPPIDIINLGREYLRGELANGDIDGMIVYGGGEGLPYQGLLSSGTLLPLGPILVVRKDSPINTPADMKGKSLGVEKNSPFYLSLNKLPQFRIVPSDTIWSLFDLVLTRRVDGIILDALPAYLYLQRIHKQDLRFVLPPLTNAGIKIFVLPTPNGKKTLEIFDQNIARLVKENKILPIFEKWGFADFPTLSPDAPPLPADGTTPLNP